jgi:CRP/FNR family transcriptional regulator, cyclic AMP receptor protein
LISRFLGAGRPLLLSTLRDQAIVNGNTNLAERVAEIGKLEHIPAGTVLIEQGSDTNDLYLILSGKCDLTVNGRVIASRGAGEHVGEMSAIEPRLPRASSVIATEETVVLTLTASQFADLGREFPEMWPAVAKVLARRLHQRNIHVPPLRDAIRVFIISSTEAIDVARAIEDQYEHDPFKTHLWTHGTFKASWYPVESLEAELDRSDFAIAIAHPDDLTTSRDVTTPSPRDNVIFELGLFIGRLGRKRSILMEPKSSKIKLPSDLSGITTVPYTFDPREAADSIAPACNRLRNLFKELGPYL